MNRTTANPITENSSRRIHVVGASGSGTSTLGRNLGRRMHYPVFDTDDFYWLPSEPPFQNKRPVPERIARLELALSQQTSWVLSGSLAGWGDAFVPQFTHVLFLTLPKAVRMARLHAREVERYGAVRIAYGGDLHEAHTAFMQWAEAYDTPDLAQRSLEGHNRWIAGLPDCIRVIRLDSTLPPDELADACVAMIGR